MVLPQDLLRKMVAEAIGTFILVLAGTGAAIVGGSYAFGFGFGLIAIVYAIGHISGAHVNPAISLGLAVTGRFPMAQVPYYIGSQIVGAILASLFLRLVHGNLNGLGATSVVDGYSLLDGFLLELVGAAILVFVVCAVATDKRVQPAVVGLAIGATLLFIELVAGPITGGSVNPARSLGPALASWSFSDIWIYLTAPFIGGAIGAVGYEFIRGPEGWAEDRPAPEGPPPSEDPPRRQQSNPPGTRRAAQAPDLEPDPNVGRRRRQTQRPPAYEFVEEEFVETPGFADDPLPPPARRPSRQAPRGFGDDYPTPRPQRRRPPQQ
jgi:MIP family channel proteins